MPIFEKKEGKMQTREVLDIIFDMLSTDVPEDKILAMLIQMGMDANEAQKTLSAAKQRYTALVQSSLSAAVDRLLAKEKEELMERVDSKVDSLKKEILLKQDMKSPEQQKYIDSKLAGVGNEMNAMKGDLFSTKVEINNRLQTLEEKAGKEQRRSIDVLVPVILIIVGIFVLFYGANEARDKILNYDSTFLPQLALYSIVMLLGLVFIIVGFQKYPRETMQFKPAGLDYVK